MSKAHTGARTQNTRKHTFGIHAAHHLGSLAAECSCRRSHWFLKKEQRAANRAKLEQIELVVEDSEHKCSRAGAISLTSSILLLILFNNFKVQRASAHRCQLVATFYNDYIQLITIQCVCTLAIQGNIKETEQARQCRMRLIEIYYLKYAMNEHIRLQLATEIWRAGACYLQNIKCY